MPKLIFRPNLWGCPLALLVLSVMGVGSVALARMDMRIAQTFIVFVWSGRDYTGS